MKFRIPGVFTLVVEGPRWSEDAPAWATQGAKDSRTAGRDVQAAASVTRPAHAQAQRGGDRARKAR